jgi:hypothetical protein
VIRWPDVGVLELSARAPARRGAFPRPPGEAAYVRRPADIGDGWTTANARDTGMGECADATITRASSTRGHDAPASLIHSMLVARGKLGFRGIFLATTAIRRTTRARP